MLDNMITIEGLFTYVFFTKMTLGDNERMEYRFMTQTDGTTTGKSPMGCFDDLLIDNDLKYVFDKIDEYNN